MSYNKLIERNLVRAFKLLKDLAIDVTFTRQSSSEFNFATGTATVNAESPKVVKAVVLDSDKSSDKSNSVKKSVLFKTKDVGNLNSYDTVVLPNGVSWKLGPVIKDTGFVAYVELLTEV